MPYQRLSSFVCLLALACPVVSAASVIDGATPAPWVNATGNLASEAAGSNIWHMTPWPGQGLIVASMTKKSLWASADAGVTWKRLGEPGKRPADAGQAVQFVVDPEKPERLWCSGMYGFACWRTDDGGKTFTQLGSIAHLDGMAVDFSDPERKILLEGQHEQARSLMMSTDGGKAWTKIGDRLPEDSSFSTLPIIFDSKNFVVNASGWGPKKWGIYRSSDAGQTWQKVADSGPMDIPLVTKKGHIFWSMLWNGDHTVSRDGGKTWAKLNDPVRAVIIELPDGTLVGHDHKDQAQLYASTDDGATWKPIGQKTPFKPRGIIYDAKSNAFFAFREDGKGDLLARWDLKPAK